MLIGLAALAVGLATYYYFAGPAALPLLLVPHLLPQSLTLQTLAVGPVLLPVQASGFGVSLTHDIAGPFAQPLAAGLFIGLLAGALAGWVAVASTLRRGPFVAAMVPVIFLLMSLNLDLVGVFSVEKQYFLVLALALVADSPSGCTLMVSGCRWRGGQRCAQPSWPGWGPYWWHAANSHPPT